MITIAHVQSMKILNKTLRLSGRTSGYDLVGIEI